MERCSDFDIQLRYRVTALRAALIFLPAKLWDTTFQGMTVIDLEEWHPILDSEDDRALEDAHYDRPDVQGVCPFCMGENIWHGIRPCPFCGG